MGRSRHTRFHFERHCLSGTNCDNGQVEGIGYDFVPDVLDRSHIDFWVKTEDPASLRMARRLIREEGLLCGGSSGASTFAAVQVRIQTLFLTSVLRSSYMSVVGGKAAETRPALPRPSCGLDS